MIDRGSAAIGLAIVLAANALYLAGSARVLDPMLTMDPFYIDMARRPLGAILTQDPSWGPLYALWLKPFVAVLHDPVTVYLAGWVDGNSAKGRMRVEGRSDGAWMAQRKK